MKSPHAWTGHFRASPAKWNISDSEIVVKALLEAKENQIVRPFDKRKLEYRPKALKAKIGSVTIDPTIYGCSSQAYQASVSWPDLAEGTYSYFVYLDSEQDINEEYPPQSEDNVGKGIVTVYPNQINLPVVRSAN